VQRELQFLEGQLPLDGVQWVRHRFVSDLTSELSALAFVAQNKAKVVDLARNQAANARFL
jgi:hypothetical protein